MDNLIVGAGIACMAAALIGGGLKAFGMEIPLFSSLRRQVLLFLFGGAILALGLGAFDKDITGGGILPPPVVPKTEAAVMRPLELDINRQGFDFDAFGQPAGNAEICAEKCRIEPRCVAMTFVKSTGICWLKTKAPPVSSNTDMISALKDGS